MRPYGLIVAYIWLAFAVVWAVTALRAKRTLQTHWLNSWRARVIVAVLVLAVLAIRRYLFHARGPDFISGVIANPALNIAGLVLAAVGIGVAVWARLYLGRNWGMPMSVKENAELVTTGPYAYVRNPIYAGIALATLGSALIDWWWAVFLACAVAYFVYSAKVEERILLREFPDSYPAYKARTKSLIPFVY
ncbi:MAG: isoprenylcysteine carboxylmethyltransferase family protein [Bradyrhizobiaceae bacterium]|nr:isoprenylcysteine carboxylmethyltransferase family protein [Bradyrhizobiaceae bacterium]